ncbi:MAG: exonuclease domain-containing protein [Desulfovermiculus sp.]|nr:exonuclease domain-containing protein [Desulfovermiculus sp.]
MNLKHKFWLVTLGLPGLALFILAVSGAFLFISLPAEAQGAGQETLQPYLGWILFGLFFALMAYLLLINDIFHAYILPLDRISEETTLIATVNPGHRIPLAGCAEFKRLARSINEAAERLQGLQQTLGDHLQKVTAELERERSILAAVIAHLPQAVIGANAVGSILLYNERARKIFPCSEQECPDGFVCGFLGLGRSVYSLVEPGMLEYALQAGGSGLKARGPVAGVNFMLRGPADRLLKAVLVPIAGSQEKPGGFILILEDVSAQIYQERHAMDILEWFMEETQSQTAGVCASIDELLHKNRPHGQESLQAYRSMICDTVYGLRVDLQQGMQDLSQILGTDWPIHRIRLQDLLQVIHSEAQVTVPMQVHLSGGRPDGFVKGEVFTLVQTVLTVLGMLRNEHDVHNVWCSGRVQGERVHIVLTWRGEPVPANTLTAWRMRPVLGGDDPVLRIRDVFKRHAAEWSSQAEYAGLAELSIALPAGADEKPIEEAEQTTDSQPMYDFTLLDQGTEEEGDDPRLADLIYTVFDLETTGLDVRSGDEIVAIAGVRVVNGRIVGHEVFEQLIDPGRPVPQEAVRVHGLDNERLQGKPRIKEILPLFYKFAEGTVLVAHCADFDMGFLWAREEKAGIRFSNPVLDTFKLSVLVHPTKKKHDLESISQRLGTSLHSRHSAMGDTWTTAEIFLRLLPLLNQQGISTLHQAMQASQSSKNAQLNMTSFSVGKNDYRDDQMPVS